MKRSRWALCFAALTAWSGLPAGAVSPPFLVGPQLEIADGGHYPALGANAEGLAVVAWLYPGSDLDPQQLLAARIYTAQGELLAELPVAIGSEPGDPLDAPAVAVAEGGAFLVAWEAADGAGDGIFARRYPAGSSPAGAAFQVNQTTAGDQFLPALAAVPGGGFLAVWCGLPTDGSGAAVYGRRFDAAGQPLGGELRLNTTAAGNQLAPAVAAFDGGFVVAWHTIAGEGQSIVAQRLAADLAPVGAELALAGRSPGPQLEPAVAVSRGDGGEPVFAIAWYGPDHAAGRGAWVQRFDQDGHFLGPAERPSDDIGQQLQPGLAFDTLGGLNVSWSDLSAHGQGTVRGRRLDGRPPLLPPAENYVISPGGTFGGGSELATLPDGDFLAVWESSFGIHAQRFSAHLIFADGFENGLTSGWSDTFPFP